MTPLFFFMEWGRIKINKAWKRLFVLSTGAGILEQVVVSGIVVKILVQGHPGEWTAEMSRMLEIINVVFSVACFVWIGLNLRKHFDRIDIAKGAVVLVVYSAVVIAVEQISQRLGVYSVGTAMILYLPIHIFTAVTRAISSIAGSLQLWMAIPSILAPMLYTFFGRRINEDDAEEGS